jgi:CRP-like cAMP-binding protein
VKSASRKNAGIDTLVNARLQGAATVNCLLSALSAEEYGLLKDDLEAFPLVVRQILYSVGDPIDYVYFPEQGIVSLITLLADGSTAETASIGREGIAGLSAFFGRTLATSDWVVQVGDHGSVRMPRDKFAHHLETMPHLASVVAEYAASLFDMVSQTAACNALHSLPERLSRWLLIRQDRVEQQSFHLTQEYVAAMLAVRRPTVSVAAGALQAAGLIRYRRGHVEVLDREGLEDAACECYEDLKRRLRIGALKSREH